MFTGTFGWDQFIVAEQATEDTIDVKKAYIEMTGGDVTAGVLLSQIIYWHLPSKKEGLTKLRVKRDGHLWLAKTYEAFEDETGINKRRAERAYSVLVKCGLIEKHVWKFAAKNAVHVRIRRKAFLKAYSDVISQNFLKHQMVFRETPDGASRNNDSSFSSTKNTTKTPTKTTQEIKQEEDSISEKTEIGAPLDLLQIPEGLRERAGRNLSEYELLAALLLTAAFSKSNPSNYLAKILRSWLDDSSERASGVKSVRHLWRCTSCDTWNRRELACKRCFKDRAEVGEWAIPRQAVS